MAALLTKQPITVAVTAALTPVVNIAHFLGIPDRLVLQANFNYGSGGTTVDAYVQTSLDGGTTWTDIANFHFTTASAVKYMQIAANTAVLAAVALTDAALTANTAINLLGPQIRVKYTTTGTYAGGTWLDVQAYFG